MGVVFLARDVKLQRDVALKLLPDRFAADEDRLVRFQREAQILATLNHPNIAQIYGLEESSDTRCIVMELVGGETLQERLRRGPIPVDEALPIAKQVAEALEAAHEKGIIHRDLKPANIKLTPQSKVKVLDFGLARIFDPQPENENLSNSPTMASRTAGGVILGTAAYMSPEQARGKPVDKRTDVWAFGCLLFEMLSGGQTFHGETLTDIIASIVRGEPEWRALPDHVSPKLRSLLRRCLEKDPSRRMHEIADVRIEIDEAIANPAAFDHASTPVQTSSRLPWVLSATLLLLLLATVAWIRFRPEPVKGTSLARLSVIAPELLKDPFIHLALSPDGRRLAYVGSATGSIGSGAKLYLRNLDSLKAVPLAGTEGALAPFWSPDSRFIGFFTADGKLKKIDISGGPSQTLCEAANFGGGTWNRDGIILFSTSTGGMFKVLESGGNPDPVTEIDAAAGEFAHVWPHFLPDGRHFVYTTFSFIGNGNGAVWAGSLDSKDRKVLIESSTTDPVNTVPGYLLFSRDGSLMAQAFDTDKFQFSGAPFPIAEQIAADVGFGGVASISAADNATIAYVQGDAGNRNVQLSWYDRSGKKIQDVGVPSTLLGIDLSPSGKQIAAHRHEGTGGDIWLYESERGTNPRFTFDSDAENVSPIWSPDGTQIVFAARTSGSFVLYRKASNGSSNQEELMKSKDPIMPMAWSPDGQTIIYAAFDPKTFGDLWGLPLTGERKPFPIVRSKFWEGHAQFSPDGKWIASWSTETGRPEIYVQPFPPTGAKWQVSTNGGNFPRWSHDGKEVFYMERPSGGRIMAVDVAATGSAVKTGPPKPLFESPYTNFGHTGFYHTFAVSPDGQRFLIPHPVTADKGPAETSSITLILNWSGRSAQ
jgi:serine/threonine protein kinase